MRKKALSGVLVGVLLMANSTGAFAAENTQKLDNSLTCWWFRCCSYTYFCY